MVSLTELRSHTFFNMAIFDLTGTFVIALIIHAVLWMYPLNMKDKSKRSYMQYVISLIFIFVVLLGLGVIAHRIFSIESALSGYLGFNDMPRRNHL